MDVAGSANVLRGSGMLTSGAGTVKLLPAGARGAREAP